MAPAMADFLEAGAKLGTIADVPRGAPGRQIRQDRVDGHCDGNAAELRRRAWVSMLTLSTTSAASMNSETVPTQ